MPTLSNLKFKGNTNIDLLGGGVLNVSSEESVYYPITLYVINCLFESNSATNFGAIGL